MVSNVPSKYTIFIFIYKLHKINYFKNVVHFTNYSINRRRFKLKWNFEQKKWSRGRTKMIMEKKTEPL